MFNEHLRDAMSGLQAERERTVKAEMVKVGVVSLGLVSLALDQNGCEHLIINGKECGYFTKPAWKSWKDGKTDAVCFRLEQYYVPKKETENE